MVVRNRSGRIAAPRVNWGSNVDVELAYQTDIIRFRDGGQQRMAVRQNPRVSVGYKTMFQRSEMGRVMADFAESQHSPFYTTLPWRHVNLTAAAANGGSELAVDSTPFWLVDGATLIVESASSQEVVVVSGVSGSAVSIESVLDFDFPAASKVYLAYSARFDDSVTFNAETATTWTGDIRVSFVAGSVLASVEESPDTFEGVEVFMTKPNWVEAPRVTFLEPREVVDFGFGVAAVSSPTGRMTEQLQLRYTAMSRTGMESLIAFFMRMKGQRGSFFMPTWQRDVLVVSQPAPDTILVSGRDAFYGFDGSDVFNVMAARWPDGSYQLNRVSAVSLASGVSKFVFNDDWENAVDADTLLSFCPRWRLTVDTLEMSLYADTIADMALSMETIKNEEAV